MKVWNGEREMQNKHAWGHVYCSQAPEWTESTTGQGQRSLRSTKVMQIMPHVTFQRIDWNI